MIEPAHFGPFNLPKRTKRVTIIHDLTPILFPQHHRWHSQLLQKIFLKGILKRTHFVITNSQNTSKDLETFYPFTKGKNRWIYLGKESLYQPTFDEEVLKELEIHRPYFLFVGTIEPRKNLVRLLSAYEAFKIKTGAEVDLVIAGGMGWKSEEFRSALEDNPYKANIHLPGYVKKEHLPVLYSHCMAFIYPSLYEGFGFPVLEAMACGAPVLCSDISSLPEVGGEVAHYFDPEDEAAMCRLMEQVYVYSEAERDSIHQQSLTRAARFSWKTYADEFILSLEKIPDVL